MPCDVPASVFAKVPGIGIVTVGSRYFLTLLPHHRLQSNAPTCMPSGWDWVDADAPTAQPHSELAWPYRAAGHQDVRMPV